MSKPAGLFSLVPVALLAAVFSGGVLAPSPVAAQDTRASELAEKLNDPMTQYAIAGMLSAMSKAVLDMRVEPFAKAMESMPGRPMRDVPPDATVGDLSGMRHEDVREELIDHVPQMMGAMGRMAGALEEMKPEIEAMSRKMQDAVPRN